eukprot:m.75733 g.75733  ORF g.75733 m.75733 type:complete len:339 (-) comp9014_c1_seq2:151-1167(-)
MLRIRWSGVGLAALALVVIVGTAHLAGLGADVGGTQTGWRYAVMIDAGSSGTRVYVYRWNLGQCLASGIPNVTAAHKADGSNAVLKVEPGLSFYVEAPHKVTDSIGQLLRFAEAHVPVAQHASTPLRLMATAGMRMLPQKSQAAILGQVRQFLDEHSVFEVPSGGIEIITGDRESLFTWIAANYGLGRFSSAKGDTTTIGCLDMGGASAQVAYEVGPRTEVPDTGQFVIASVWGRRVYAGTLQGFGSNEARRRYVDVLREKVGDGKIVTDPCLPPGLAEEQPAEDGTDVSLVGTGDFDDCYRRVVPLLRSPPYGSFADTVLPAPRHPSGDWFGISEYW